jgi:CRP/FNR family transcriptional regulator, cyclic AMP receptor protein
MPRKGPSRILRFNPSTIFTRMGVETSVRSYWRKQVIFSQGDIADAVFFVQKGRVKLTVVCKRGKEAIVALHGPDEFFGEGCLAGQPLRMSTATAPEDTTICHLRKKAVVRLLHRDPKFSELFTAYLLSRNIRFEEDLVDQLFNSSEKRLAGFCFCWRTLAKMASANP